jgi:hypothetical protein
MYEKKLNQIVFENIKNLFTNLKTKVVEQLENKEPHYLSVNHVKKELKVKDIENSNESWQIRFITM